MWKSSIVNYIKIETLQLYKLYFARYFKLYIQCPADILKNDKIPDIIQEELVNTL